MNEYYLIKIGENEECIKYDFYLMNEYISTLIINRQIEDKEINKLIFLV